MRDNFQKKFSVGDILSLVEDYEGIDKDKYGVVCVIDTDKYVMFYLASEVDGNGNVLLDYSVVDEHYEKIGECDGADELMFTGHVSFKKG